MSTTTSVSDERPWGLAGAATGEAIGIGGAIVDETPGQRRARQIAEQKARAALTEIERKERKERRRKQEALEKKRQAEHQAKFKQAPNPIKAAMLALDFEDGAVRLKPGGDSQKTSHSFPSHPNWNLWVPGILLIGFRRGSMRKYFSCYLGDSDRCIPQPKLGEGHKDEGKI